MPIFSTTYLQKFWTPAYPQGITEATKSGPKTYQHGDLSSWNSVCRAISRAHNRALFRTLYTEVSFSAVSFALEYVFWKNSLLRWRRGRQDCSPHWKSHSDVHRWIMQGYGRCSLIPITSIFDHFQYEIWQGKAWEIWSSAMTSTRQMVDTWWCPTVILPVSRRSVPGFLNNEWWLSALWMLWHRTDSKRKDIEILCWASPCVCTWPDLPGLSLPYFILETAWEWG